MKTLQAEWEAYEAGGLLGLCPHLSREIAKEIFYSGMNAMFLAVLETWRDEPDQKKMHAQIESFRLESATFSVAMRDKYTSKYNDMENWN